MAFDAPDWQHVVKLADMATVDSPDWQDTVVGPGGTPISGGGYDSLTGPGETNSSGDLSQDGGFVISDVVSDAHNTTGVQITSNKKMTWQTSAGIVLETTGVDDLDIIANVGSINLEAEVTCQVFGATTIIGGGGGRLGFFGSLTDTQRTITGSKGGNAALTSLLTALADYGLIIDNST